MDQNLLMNKLVNIYCDFTGRSFSQNKIKNYKDATKNYLFSRNVLK